MKTYEEIVQMVKAEVENIAGAPVADPNEEIFKSGYLDSLNILHIITFLEATFAVEIDPFSVNLDTLGSLNKIAEFIHAKQGV